MSSGLVLWGWGETQNGFKKRWIRRKEAKKIKFAGFSVTFTSKFDYKSGFSLKSHQWDVIWCLSSANSGLGHWAASPAGRPRSSSSSFLPELFWEAFQNKIGAAINISWMCLRVHVAQTTPSVASPADVWSTLLDSALVLNASPPQPNTGGAPNIWSIYTRLSYEWYQPLHAAMLSNIQLWYWVKQV